MAHGDNTERFQTYMQDHTLPGPSNEIPPERLEEPVIPSNRRYEDSTEEVKQSRSCWSCCRCHYDYKEYTYTVLGKKSENLTCPSCRLPMKTRRTFVTTNSTRISAILLCPIGCCFLPHCFNLCKRVTHHCSICGAYIGISK